jgi:hypothetical protein
MVAYVMIILQYVILCYSVVNSNSTACGRKSSVLLNLLLDETDTVFSSVTWGMEQKLSTVACECGVCCYSCSELSSGMYCRVK